MVLVLHLPYTETQRDYACLPEKTYSGSGGLILLSLGLLGLT